MASSDLIRSASAGDVPNPRMRSTLSDGVFLIRLNGQTLNSCRFPINSCQTSVDLLTIRFWGKNEFMVDNESDGIGRKLHRLIETIDIANLLTEPLTDSITKILTISAADLDSDEASVLIRDGDQGDLRFLAAIGQVAEQLLNIKIPAGKGIAGFVLSSGQPMVVADVGEEESFYVEVDRSTGYSTQMILATPLRYKDEVIGVLEYINRRGDPPYRPFTPDEMDKAALCAEAIASLVNAYQSVKLFRDFGEKLLADDASFEVNEVREWLMGIRDSAEHREMMDLAVLLRELASRGEAERTLCREMLESFLRYSDGKSETSFLSF